MERTINRKVVSLICAKKHSKRFPGKHYAEYAGAPLWRHTFDFAKKLSLEVWVFTDDEELKEIASSYSFNVIHDPGNWGGDPQMDMMKFLHSEIKADIYIMLPITSPDRDIIKLRQFLSDFMKSHFADSATSIEKIRRGYQKLSGAFWFFKSRIFETDDVINDSTIYFKMHSIDVDTEADLEN